MNDFVRIKKYIKDNRSYFSYNRCITNTDDSASANSADCSNSYDSF